MKNINMTINIICGLLLLIFVEGMMTLGHAFDFASYNWFGWLVQLMLVVLTISLSIKYTLETK